MVEVSVMVMYCDGGVVRRNPSPIGGTWACVFVGMAGEEVERASGFVGRDHVGMDVTNNYTELLATVEGMERLEDGWDGCIQTDSNVTRFRLTLEKPSMHGIPQALRDRLAACKARLGKFDVTLLNGHPTKDELFKGVGRRGLPTSRWNVLCDQLCGEEARRAMAHCEVAS
jgi:ribonuclease HI